MDKNQKLDRTTARFFYSLIQSAVLDQPLSAWLDTPDMEAVFHYAHLNSISGLLYYSIYLNGLSISTQLDERWKKELYETVYYNLSLKEYWKELKQQLNLLDINYMPIKGAVLQECYSKPGMRAMSDYDILYRYGDDEERGMTSRSLQKLRSLNGKYGVQVISSGGIVDSLYMEKHILFEMHREFLGSDQPGYEYYHRIWDLSVPTENCHEFRLSDSEQFILMLVHSHKHYSSAGCGPKELIDYYIVKNSSSMSLDWTYIEKTLTEFNLKDYEMLLDRLTKIIFEDVPGTEQDWIELERWIKAGTYGNEQRSLNQQISEYTDQGYSVFKAKSLYLAKRLYPSKAFVKDQFPFFYEHPLILPLLPLYRVFRSRKGILEKVKNELMLLNNTDLDE